MSDKNRTIIKKILDEIGEIHSFLYSVSREAFLQNKLLQKAVVMTLINIGELTKHLTPEFTQRIPSIPWNKIKGLRNLAAHQYDDLKMPNIWETLSNDIPVLESTLHKEVMKSSPEQSPER